MAMYILICLSAYLRPAAGLALRRGCLVPPGAQSRGRWCLYLAPRELRTPTKTGCFDDTVVLDSRWLTWAGPIFEALRGDGSMEPMWDFTYADLVKRLDAIRAQFGIPDLVPYQLRHSGASIDRESGARSLLDIQKRGQWRAASSVFRYEKAGRLATTEASYPSGFARHGRACERQLEAFILLGKAPPPRFTATGAAGSA